MPALDMCKTMENELVAWKASVYDILRKIDKKPGVVKQKLLDNIEDIHILVEELDERIEQVRTSCSIDGGMDDIQTEREKYHSALANVRVRVDDAIQVLSGGNFGG